MCSVVVTERALPMTATAAVSPSLGIGTAGSMENWKLCDTFYYADHPNLEAASDKAFKHHGEAHFTPGERSRLHSSSTVLHWRHREARVLPEEDMPTWRYVRAAAGAYEHLISHTHLEA